MAESAAIRQAKGNCVRSAMVEYIPDGQTMAEDDTIGISVGTSLNGVEVVASAAYLQTVPAGGQTVLEALTALAALIVAGTGCKTRIALNSDENYVLHVTPKQARAAYGGANEVTIATPVFAIA